MVDAEHACADLLRGTRPTEVCVAPADGCVAAFASPRASCDAVCAAAGLECDGAFDDAHDNGRCPAGAPVDASRALHSKVCSCARRRCDDDGGCGAHEHCVAGRCHQVADGARCETPADCAEAAWPRCEQGMCVAPPPQLAREKDDDDDAASGGGVRRRSRATTTASRAAHECELLHRDVRDARDMRVMFVIRTVMYDAHGASCTVVAL